MNASGIENQNPNLSVEIISMVPYQVRIKMILNNDHDQPMDSALQPEDASLQDFAPYSALSTALTDKLALLDSSSFPEEM